ncbi:MAG: 50S ribosomal protein L16 [Candidatus Dependentiae bacterium]|nr:50S ribosomal protein L16 [Candidatus Dependentiae bacterium]
MLMPKKTKYRKVQKGNLRGRSKGARTIHFGEYGLQAMEPSRLTAQQIEAMRVTVSRSLKKVGTFFLRVFPDKPVTKKPAETRMGKGKGNPELWVSVVKRGRVVCEVAGLSEVDARKVLRSAAYKLPMKTKIIKKDQEVQF